jgi:hypothetical protein
MMMIMMMMMMTLYEYMVILTKAGDPSYFATDSLGFETL